VELEDEAVLSGDAMAFRDLGHFSRKLGNLRQLAGHGTHANENRDGQSERGRLQLNPIASDHACRLEADQALSCRRRGHAYFAREL
jgi:hypothetical protein